MAILWYFGGLVPWSDFPSVHSNMDKHTLVGAVMKLWWDVANPPQPDEQSGQMDFHTYVNIWKFTWYDFKGKFTSEQLCN